MKFLLYRAKKRSKYNAVFIEYIDGYKVTKVVQFGSINYENFTEHGDISKRNAMIKRLEKFELNNPYNKKTLSYYIAYGPNKNIYENMRLFKLKFNFE